MKLHAIHTSQGATKQIDKISHLEKGMSGKARKDKGILSAENYSFETQA